MSNFLFFQANPKGFEGMDDLILLPHLNEVALVYNLHARFLNSLPYTYVADFALIAFNPMRKLDIYNESVGYTCLVLLILRSDNLKMN